MRLQSGCVECNALLRQPSMQTLFSLFRPLDSTQPWAALHCSVYITVILEVLEPLCGCFKFTIFHREPTPMRLNLLPRAFGVLCFNSDGFFMSPNRFHRYIHIHIDSDHYSACPIISCTLLTILFTNWSPKLRPQFEVEAFPGVELSHCYAFFFPLSFTLVYLNRRQQIEFGKFAIRQQPTWFIFSSPLAVENADHCRSFPIFPYLTLWWQMTENVIANYDLGAIYGPLKLFNPARQTWRNVTKTK